MSTKRKSVGIRDLFGPSSSSSSSPSTFRASIAPKSVSMPEIREILLKQNDNEVEVEPLVREVLDSISRRMSSDKSADEKIYATEPKRQDDTKRTERMRKLALLVNYELKVIMMERGSTLLVRGENSNTLHFIYLSRNHKEIVIGELMADNAKNKKMQHRNTIATKVIHLNSIRDVVKGYAPSMGRKLAQRTMSSGGGIERSQSIGVGSQNQTTSPSDQSASALSMSSSSAVDRSQCCFYIAYHLRRDDDNETKGTDMDILEFDAKTPGLFSLWYDGLRQLVHGSTEKLETVNSYYEVAMNFSVFHEIDEIKREINEFNPYMQNDNKSHGNIRLPDSWDFNISLDDVQEHEDIENTRRVRSNAVFS